jgi:nitrous oxidase accessory protein NosD
MGVRRGAFAAVFAVAGVSWALTASAGAADGVDCGSVITENTVLTHDLLDCENGLTVAAPDVTLDLGGHQIGGRGAGIGVLLEADGAVVRGGAIRDFHAGVALGHGAFCGAEMTVSHLELSSNEVGLENTMSCPGVRIESSTIHDNGDGVFLFGGGGLVEIVDNQVLDNGRFGIYVNDRPARLVQGNLVMRNGADGIILQNTHTMVIGNTSSRNGGDGITIWDSNCNHLNFYRLGSNLTDGNHGLGIDISLNIAICPPESTPHDLLDAGGNAANNNGNPLQCTIYITCARNRGQAR